jgi:hypothetical protein
MKKQDGKIRSVGTQIGSPLQSNFHEAEGEGFGNMGKGVKHTTGKANFVQSEGSAIPSDYTTITTSADDLYLGAVVADPLGELELKIKGGLIKNTEDLFEAALDTMRRKNADYSGDNKGMRNFELSAEVSHTPMSLGILNRLMDKMTRIGNLLNKDQVSQVKDESCTLGY